MHLSNVIIHIHDRKNQCKTAGGDESVEAGGGPLAG